MPFLGKFCFGLLAITLPVMCWSQIDPSQVMPVDPNVRIGKLSNGLTYYIRRNTLPEKRVELRLVVNTGSVMEDEDQRGLAHFMEHMNFNGTKRFPKNQLVNYLQSIGVQFGADLNAYTSFDETVYILPVPTDKPGLVETGLQILEDWAHNALLDSIEIEKERGVIIEEWRLSRGADERMMRTTMPVQYKGSRYADRLPIGTKESLEKFSAASLKRFYKDWYRPDLQAVIAVGDIDVAEMEQMIKNIFSDIPAGTSRRQRELFYVPDHTETLTVIAKDKETAFPTVTIMYKKNPVTETTIGDYSRYMNRMLFTGMLNNRLKELTLQANPPFIAAYSSYNNTYARTKDAFQVQANSSDTGMTKTLSALFLEMRRLEQYGFTSSELELQKKQIQSFYDRIFHDRTKVESFRYVDEYVNHFLINEPIPSVEWEYDFVKQHLGSVKLDEINKLAGSWITRDNLVITLNAPDKPGVEIPSANEIQQLVEATRLTTIEPYKERILATSLMDGNKLKSGKIITSIHDEDLGTTTLKLSNGLTVILKPTTFKNDEIIIRGFSKGGHSLVKDPDYYSGSLAASLVQQSGVGNFSANDLGNMLKGKNTNVTPNISLYSEGITGNTVPKEVETMLQLVHLYFTSPRKDKDAYHSFITRQKQLYTNIASSPQIYYGSEFQKTMTKNHPRAGGLLKPEDFDKMNLDRAIEIYKERFSNASDFTFFIVGAIDEESIRPLIEKYLGSLPSSNKKENFKDLGIRPPSGKVEKQVFKGSEPQSQVNIVFTQPASYNAKDVYALKTLGELLSIKLVEQLREEKGSVYGISAIGNMNRYPVNSSSFYISFPCAPENVDMLTNAAIAELNKIIVNGVNENDLAKVREQQKRKLEVELKQNQFWMTQLYDAYYNGYDARFILSREKMTNDLSSTLIQNVAKKYIAINKYIRVTLLPEKDENNQLKPF